MLPLFPTDYHAESQELLEQTIPRIARIIPHEPSSSWTATDYKPQADEQLHEDTVCAEIWRETADSLGALYLNEESTCSESDATRSSIMSSPGRFILVSDPIDGSSEWNRMGWRRSPLATAALLLRIDSTDNGGRFVLCGAVVGDLWQERTFGMRGNTLVSRFWDQNDAQTVSLETAKHALGIADATVAAYCPAIQTVDLLRPCLEQAPYFHNNGGMLTALRVVDSSSVRSYAISLEPRPSPLWEHAGPILASFAGASVSRLDGAPLTLDPFIWQTSITAVNDTVLREVVSLLTPSYKQCGVVHHKPSPHC